MKRIALLDYGRFLAAIAVITFHYLFNGINNGKISSITYIPWMIDFSKYGYLGVEFFFMISGYVIFLSAKNRTAGEFIASRAVRLYPAYWVAVIFTSLVSIFFGGEKMTVSFLQALANLTMVSPVLGFPYVDGVYWSLLFELKFYFLVSALLFIGLSNRLRPIFLAWPFVIAIATLSGKSHITFFGGYYCFFAAGAIFAILKEKNGFLPIIALIVSLALCINFSVGLSTKLAETRAIFYSQNIISFTIITFFLFFSYVNTKAGSNFNLYGSKLVGGLTYPIYLIHAHFGYMIISHFATEKNKFVVYFFAFSFSFTVAYLIHVLVEKRLSKHWERFFSTLIGTPVATVNTRIKILGNMVRQFYWPLR